ncbi:MAG: hypothetical protein J6W54_08165 [Fibrobacter sp.]|uniref:hypothetical protein n=1 Tax=Fibrobacter sp. TaxID=35828 RepID=UPI001B012085|nr:hypothetical protein [Fibrobacter sp.]MBO7061049.1 hypothetical protein [Fibrobacter sp.]
MAEQVNNDTTVTTAPTAFKKGDFKNMEMFKKAKHHADSVQNVIVQLQKDSLVLAKDVEVLTAENANLVAKVKFLDSTNKAMNDTLLACKDRESPVAAITSPSGCAVLIVLIIALTIIALKKGFSISKGDACVSVGDKKKDQE